MVGTDGRRTQGLTAGGPRPVAAGPDASGACRRPCARNGGRSRPPGPGDARRTPSGPRAPCRAAAAQAAGAGPVEPLAHPRVRRRLPHAEERAQVPRPDRVLAAPHLPAGLQKRRDPGREDREPRHQAVSETEVARDGRVGDAVEACTHGVKHGPGIDGCLRKESLDICCPAFACLSAARPIRRGKSVTGKFVTAVQSADNERKEILSGIAVRISNGGTAGRSTRLTGAWRRFRVRGWRTRQFRARTMTNALFDTLAVTRPLKARSSRSRSCNRSGQWCLTTGRSRRSVCTVIHILHSLTIRRKPCCPSVFRPTSKNV